MSLEIFLTLCVVVLTLVAFLREWASPDVLALSILCLLVALGLIEMGQMSTVFKNEAPLTIAALFIIGGALERSGAIDLVGKMMQKRVIGGLRTSILAFAVVAAFFSAWMNNTAIVAILLPVVLGFSRSREIAPSKLLIPLSYSSILGGCCTLIGTSTNLLVNGSLKDLGLEPMGMFDLAPVGIPLAIAGLAYLVAFGPRLLPERASIIGSLEIELRSVPLYHLLVGNDSEMIGKKLLDTKLGERESGIHILEVRRRGARVMKPLGDLVIEVNDRFMVAIHRRKGGAMGVGKLLEGIGCQELSKVDGMISELVVPADSSLVGRTLAESDFRQSYNSVVLAVHRNGLNITSRMAEVSIERGDTLLVITAVNNLPALKATRDFVLTDSLDTEAKEEEEKPLRRWPIIFAWGTLILVVAVVSISDLLSRMIEGVTSIPIHYAAMVGALALLWGKVLSPREAYESIDWQVLLMLYGLLGLGMAMQGTGTAEWLAGHLVGFTQGFVSAGLLPFVLLWIIFIFTSVLTEVLSNNATAVMLVPIVVQIATQLGVDSRPFIMCITIAASCAFALPMGYQTHMMVYGPGGYKFSDYIKIGVPLNVIACVTTCAVIPFVWSF